MEEERFGNPGARVHSTAGSPGSSGEAAVSDGPIRVSFLAAGLEADSSGLSFEDVLCAGAIVGWAVSFCEGISLAGLIQESNFVSR